jgi:peptide/nickel transport system substrate-binding protein
LIKSHRLTRRQALAALAAGGTAGALGLGPGRSLIVEDAKAATSEFHGAWPYLVPPQGHYNTYITDGSSIGILGIYQDLLEAPLAMYRWHDQKYTWLLGTGDQFVNGTDYVVHLRQGAHWSDGSPVVAQDIINTWTIWQMLGNTLFSYVDSMHAPNNYTVVFHMKVPSTSVQRYVLHQATANGNISSVRASSVYGSWATRFRQLLASGHDLSSPEVKALRAEFVQFRPTSQIVSGPYQIDPTSITQGQLTLNRNPNSWAKDMVKFDKIVLYNGETAVITPVVLAGLVDYATHGFPPATDREFRQKGFTVISTPTYYGFGILPNYKRVPSFQDARVRQALMYMINRPQMGPVVEGKGGIPNQYVTGMSDHLVPIWLDSATISKLNTYPYDPQKGVSLLQSAGWKKGSDGVWVTPDGQKATWEILAEGEYVDILSLATNFADQLAPYGFKLSARTVAFTVANDVRYAGNFQLTSYEWASADPHPHFAWVSDILNWIPPSSSGPGSGFNTVQKTTNFGTVDLRTLIEQTALGLDVGKQKALCAKMALIYNELIPFLPFVERYGLNPTQPPGVHRVAGWPALSDPIYLNSPYSDSFVVLMLYGGVLHPA